MQTPLKPPEAAETIWKPFESPLDPLRLGHPMDALRPLRQHKVVPHLLFHVSTNK